MTTAIARIALVAALALTVSVAARTESRLEYENRFRMMVDFSVRSNEYVRQHLSDRALAAYAQRMAAQNAEAAEQMTPPGPYAMIHPHFLLVLENVERSFFYAAQGKLERYRHYQKVVRKELQLLESLAERDGLELYLWRGDR
jgi:hypothetical protein